MRHQSIRFEKHTVTKIAAPELMRVEVEKTRRAFKIGSDTGLFRVPRVLDYDEQTGAVVLERITGIEPILARTSPPTRIVQCAGRSLAAIHESLSLPRAMTVTLPGEFATRDYEVFLHGDFNGRNVCLERSSESLVILDWQMTSRHGGRATFGTRYFDLLWFINYMLWSPGIRYLVSDPVAPVAKIFIESYFHEADSPYDAIALARYAKAFFATKLPLRKRHAKWKTRWLLWRSRMLTERFIDSLNTIHPHSAQVSW